jgi:hypothetical protein
MTKLKIQRESAFHDKVYEKVAVDEDSVIRLLNFDSPANYFGNFFQG